MKHFAKLLLLALLLYPKTATAVATIPEQEVLEFIKNDLQFENPALVLAIIRVESSANPRALVYDQNCKCHTYGMMQLQLPTARGVGFTGVVSRLYDWRTNVRYGTLYLASKLEEYTGDIPAALSAYNAGRALEKWTQGSSLRRFKNSNYVISVMAELASILTDAELMKILEDEDQPPDLTLRFLS